MPLPERVRRDTAAVAARSRAVHLDERGLRRLADRIVADLEVARPDPDPDPWQVDSDDLERAVATAVILDTVNFGSGWHPVLRKRDGCSGATTVARSVRRWLDAGGTGVERFAELGAADLAEICDQPIDEEGPAELMGLFAEALAELADLLARRFDGRVLPLVEDAAGSAARLAGELAALPSFGDVSCHAGAPVALYKRAQLAAADVARAGGGRWPARFDDLGRLTAFADNLVPHVLRLEGVLRYEPGLVDRIDRGELLVHGSEEEVEIRALGVHAVERLADAMAGAMASGTASAMAGGGAPMSPCDLDALLWRRGGGATFKSTPRHRSRCRAY